MDWESFAVIPAAGRSRRMGQPKLLLPWGNSTVIETVIATWRTGGVQRVVVVVHPEDQELAQVCRRRGAEVVVPPVPPPEMKASVLQGLQYLNGLAHPTPQAAWLTAPADLPLLSAKIIAGLLQEHEKFPELILVPLQDQHRGHPVLFPWKFAAQVATLPDKVGLNFLLLQAEQVREVAFQGPNFDQDLDTPEDYRKLLNRYHPHE